MSNLHHKVFDLLTELNPLHRLDPYRQPQNQNIMSDTPKPKMEKGDKAERGAKQGAKHTENTTRQPSVNKTINPIEQLVDITETLKTIKPTSTLSPTDATEWEEVFKPELGSSDSGSDDWEIIDERDTKPCVVAAKKLLEKRQKKVESLKKLGWWCFQLSL